MINIPKGTQDVLPQESYKWQYVESKARDIAKKFNVKEIRTPIFEHTELFQRGVGDTTDIVNKEMYTFLDKGGRSITLKPEGTASTVRSFIENGMTSNVLPAKMFYITPAFRYERPQKGRLREFHQFGVEIFGAKGADTDAELILLADNFLKDLGLTEYELNINSIGCKHCRQNFNKALKDYLAPHLGEMCPTCNERFEKNPLRILDCKEEKCKKINENAPIILDYLCDECKEHFSALKSYLDVMGVKYKINPTIVRGLDYYSKTVFEFVSTNIGSQGTILAGGRYDTLIENLGGPETAAVGFAAGMERTILLMETLNIPFGEEGGVDAYVAGMDDKTRMKAFEIANTLRRNGISCDIDHMGRSIKAQFKYADKIKAKFVCVIGGNELESGVVNVKKMANSTQESVRFEDLCDYIKTNK